MLNGFKTYYCLFPVGGTHSDAFVKECEVPFRPEKGDLIMLEKSESVEADDDLADRSCHAFVDGLVDIDHSRKAVFIYIEATGDLDDNEALARFCELDGWSDR